VTDWEERTGLPGTRRRNFGVAMDPADNYRPRATSPLPPVLAALGARLLGFCKAQLWPTACSDIRATPAFVQAYVQRYVPGETLGFHFDERPTYAELIVGLSVCGQGRLLLGHTNGSKEVAPRALQQTNVRAIDLPPGSLYCLTGMSRYDLRHAIVHDGDAERISITFRALK
jgi:alkylated DNA repair dioxygenase AlkB